MMNFSKSSTKLFFKFSTACIQIVNSKKQHYWKFYFKLMAHETIIVPRQKICGVQIKMLRLQQMKKSKEKFNRVHTTNNRDLSKWTLATHVDARANAMVSKKRINAKMVPGYLFVFGKVYIVCWKFVKLNVDIQNETTILHLIRLDAIINDSIYLFS